MAVSREKEMVERTMEGAYEEWARYNAMRSAYAALTSGQWNALRNAVGNGLESVTQAQAVAFMQARQDDAMIELTDVVNRWRLTP